jgi:hypothetical protein
LLCQAKLRRKTVSDTSSLYSAYSEPRENAEGMAMENQILEPESESGDIKLVVCGLIMLALLGGFYLLRPSSLFSSSPSAESEHSLEIETGAVSEEDPQ